MTSSAQRIEDVVSEIADDGERAEQDDRGVASDEPDLNVAHDAADLATRRARAR